MDGVDSKYVEFIEFSTLFLFQQIRDVLYQRRFGVWGGEVLGVEA